MQNAFKPCRIPFPFRTDARLKELWLGPTERLEESIRRDGKVDMPMLVARIKGDEHKKPLLYDGMGRATIVAKLWAENVKIELPQIVEKHFDSFAEVASEAFRLQVVRRNPTPAEKAFAAIRLEELVNG